MLTIQKAEYELEKGAELNPRRVHSPMLASQQTFP